MTAPISNGPTTHGYTTMRDATRSLKAITKEIGIRSERLPRLLREPRVRLRRQSPSLEETTEMQIRHR